MNVISKQKSINKNLLIGMKYKIFFITVIIFCFSWTQYVQAMTRAIFPDQQSLQPPPEEVQHKIPRNVNYWESQNIYFQSQQPSQSSQDSSTTNQAYDKNGNLVQNNTDTTSSDNNGNATDNTPPAQQPSRLPPDNNTTQTYDENGNLVQNNDDQLIATDDTETSTKPGFWTSIFQTIKDFLFQDDRSSQLSQNNASTTQTYDKNGNLVQNNNKQGGTNNNTGTSAKQGFWASTIQLIKNIIFTKQQSTQTTINTNLSGTQNNNTSQDANTNTMTGSSSAESNKSGNKNIYWASSVLILLLIPTALAIKKIFKK